MNDIGPMEEIVKENKRLREAIEELKILNDIAVAISSALALEEIMGLIVQKCIKHLEAEQGAIIVLDPEDKEKPFRTVIRKSANSQIMLPYRLDAQLMGWMLKHRKPLLINEFSSDKRFRPPRNEKHGIRSLLGVPLLLKGTMIGALNVFNKRVRETFTQADKRLLSIIATESAQVIENARLYKEEQALLRMQEEMKLAYEIQTNLLPREPPKIEAYDVAGKSIPAKAVGGDYYDFIRIDDNRMGVCLGDVSGKGMPAALLMANLQATLRSHVMQNLAPCECLKRSNDLIFRSTDADRFATLFYGVLDTKNHTLEYCNAGHNYPYLVGKDGNAVRLRTSGTVLGTFPEISFAGDRISLRPDDILLVYSDGITESLNEGDEEFSEGRLAEVVIENRWKTASDLIDGILEAVRTFAGKAPQADDITALVVKRKH